MHFDLAGASYKTSAAGAANTAGAPTSGNKALYYVCGDDNVGLCGYELTQDLTFNKDGNGATFTESSGTYTLNSADSNATYFPISDGTGGWLPIGDNTNPFVGIFDGNGYTITGLAIKRSQEYIGMFGYIDTGAHIRNVGLVANLADSSAATTTVYLGGLVGRQDGGSITASYTTGSANGGTGDYNYFGGLVGSQHDGSISASYATGSANGGGGDEDYVGGLVGLQNYGSITASYGFGDTSGGENDGVDSSTLPIEVTTAADLTAANVVGCVGIANEKAYTNQTTCEQASKTAFNWHKSTATCSGTDTGIDYAVFISEIACTGTTKGVGTWNGNAWNAPALGTAGAWDFGTSSQTPALKYSDYDSNGGDYSCDMFLPSKCDTLMPRQR